MSKSEHIERVSVIHDGNADNLKAIAVVHTKLELNVQHPKHDSGKVDQLISDSMVYITGDFPIASELRIQTIEKPHE